MFKRLILSVSFLCAVVPVRAGEYSGDLSNIQTALSEIYDTIDIMWGEVADIGQFLQSPNGWNFYDDITSKLRSFKSNLESINSIVTNLYPYLIQSYYKLETIDWAVGSANDQLVDIRSYLMNIGRLIDTLQEVVDDYENFKNGITVPLNNIDANNTEMASYVRAIYEDVDTIKALFLGESNLREMLETLWDIKNDVEYFQQRWDLQNTDIHEMFLDPFDNSGWEEAYSSIWKYYNRQFDPYAFFPESETLVQVQPSNWGAFQDICNALDAILKGNEAMNYNLIYQCQVVTAIASNLLQGVSEQSKVQEWVDEVTSARESLNSKMDEILGMRDNFKVPTPNDFSFFDTSEYYALLERYDVQSLPSLARMHLGGFSGFLNSHDSISGDLDIDSYGFLFTGIRFAFGVIYWGAYVFFMFFLVRFSLKLYSFTISRFTGISVSEKGGT